MADDVERFKEGAAAAVTGSDLQDVARVLACFQLKHAPPRDFPRSIFCDCTGKRLARMRLMWKKTLKVTCKVHHDCSLLIERFWFSDPEVVMYRWAALAKFANKAEHALAAEQIRAARRR